MNGWTKAALPGALLVLHNAQRLAPVPLFEELRARLGTDYVGVGNLFGAYLLIYALVNLPAGLLADKVNNRHLMMMGAALSLVASTVFAFARSYPVALTSRLMLGLAGAFLYVPAVRYVVISFPKEKRGLVMGFVEVGAGIGMILSLTLLPLLAKELDLLSAFLMLPALALVILVGLIFGLSSEQPAPTVSMRARFLSLGVNRSFWYLLTYFFLGMLAHYAVFGWLPTFLRNCFDYSAVRAGLASTLVTIALILGSPLAGMLSDRLRSRASVLLLGSTLSVISFVLYLFSSRSEVALGAAFLSGISMAFCIPVLIILVGEAFGSSGAGLAVSAAVTTGQIASSLSGMLFGYVLQTRNSFVAVWGLALVIAAASIPFLLIAIKGLKESKLSQPGGKPSCH